MSISNPPIIVGADSALPATLAAALRYVLGLVGSFAVGKGWVAEGDVPSIVAAVSGVIAIGYGLYKTFRNRQHLITAAEAAPNAVAQVK